jgi:iron-sulfur cluster assembly protein
MSGPIEFSPEALEAFRLQVRAACTPLKAVRFGVRGGACSGLQYVIELDYGDARPGDIEWNPPGWDEPGHHHGQDYTVMFRIDKKSLLYLKGSRVTWTRTLMRQGFDFENPNEASRCGCGHSFSAK